MRRLRRAFGILAGTEAEGVPAHFVAAAQISERSTAAVSRSVKTQSSRHHPGRKLETIPLGVALACLRDPSISFASNVALEGQKLPLDEKHSLDLDHGAHEKMCKTGASQEYSKEHSKTSAKNAAGQPRTAVRSGGIDVQILASPVLAFDGDALRHDAAHAEAGEGRDVGAG